MTDSLFYGSIIVKSMTLEDIDILYIEPLEGCLHSGEDMLQTPSLDLFLAFNSTSAVLTFRLNPYWFVYPDLSRSGKGGGGARLSWVTGINNLVRITTSSREQSISRMAFPRISSDAPQE